jgi:hypothetical protein
MANGKWQMANGKNGGKAVAGRPTTRTLACLCLPNLSYLTTMN